MALCAFQQRYLFGWAVLDVELRRRVRDRLRPTIPEAGGAGKKIVCKEIVETG